MEIELIASEFFDWLKENREVANDFPQATKAYFQPVSFSTSDWWKTNSKLIPEKFHQFLKVVFTYCDYYAPFEDVTIKTPGWNTVKDMTNEEETNAVGRFLTRASCDDKIMKFELTGKTHKLYQWNWTAFRHGFYEPMSAWGYEDPSSKKITYILMTNTCRGFDTLETRLRNELLSARFTPKITNIITRIRRLDENTVNANRAKRSNARVKAMFQFGEKQENLADAVKDLIPTLEAVLAEIGGQIGLEIELKGPEPEAVDILADVLDRHKHLWDTIEVTSFEPALLIALKQRCPGLAVDLLFPRSEPWMRLDVVAYLALHRARLAGARGVHLHPSQLSPEVVATVRGGGIEIHAWEVNDAPTLNAMLALGIPKLCTDHPQQMLDLLGRDSD